MHSTNFAHSFATSPCSEGFCSMCVQTSFSSSHQFFSTRKAMAGGLWPFLFEGGYSTQFKAYWTRNRSFSRVNLLVPSRWMVGTMIVLHESLYVLFLKIFDARVRVDITSVLVSEYPPDSIDSPSSFLSPHFCPLTTLKWERLPNSVIVSSLQMDGFSSIIVEITG